MDLRKLLSNNKTLEKKNYHKKSHMMNNKHFNNKTINWKASDVIGREYNRKTKTYSDIWLIRCKGENGLVWGTGTPESATYVSQSSDDELDCAENSQLVMKNLRVIPFDNYSEHPCPKTSIKRKNENNIMVKYVPVVVDFYFGLFPAELELDNYNYPVDSYADHPYGGSKVNTRIASYLCEQDLSK